MASHKRYQLEPIEAYRLNYIVQALETKPQVVMVPSLSEYEKEVLCAVWGHCNPSSELVFERSSNGTVIDRMEH